jgi:hypothetical protein
MIERFTPKPPAQVLAGLAAAEEIRRQLSAGNTPDNPDPRLPPAPTHPIQPRPGQPSPIQPEPVNPLNTPSFPIKPAQAGSEDESWEQRVRSVQGRYETQVQVNRQLNERLAELERTLNTMAANGQRPPAPAADPEPVRLITDKEREDFGEDFLNVVGKRAKETYAPEFDQLSRRLKNLEGKLEGTVQVVSRNQKQELYAVLDSQIANWRDINRSQQFKDWLGFVDPLSGRRRFDMLQEAFTRQEAGRVLSFFRGFTTEATGTPPSQPNPAPTPSTPQYAANGTTGSALTLEQLAAPGRARSAPQGNLPPEKPMYTNAWIAQFMADKRTGKYRGREADADLIERDIYLAQHEGRIII